MDFKGNSILLPFIPGVGKSLNVCERKYFSWLLPKLFEHHRLIKPGVVKSLCLCPLLNLPLISCTFSCSIAFSRSLSLLVSFMQAHVLSLFHSLTHTHTIVHALASIKHYKCSILCTYTHKCELSLTRSFAFTLNHTHICTHTHMH